MKTKAIIFASVLLSGGQASGHNASIPAQHAQSLSSPGESGQYSDRMLSPRWQDDGTDLTKDNDLWSHIRSGLKMKIPENIRIREQKLKYLNNKSYLHDVVLRAEPYMYWIVEQINKRKMPMELVLLPIVESAFNPHATSASDAAGIWQIVPTTGKNYGLKQTRYYDGRRDVVASTKAALDMLQRLNSMFNGDWFLTIAAYNSGEGRILNAIKRNKAAGKPTDFWHLSLPRETTIYVPKMLALSDILKNNARYGVKLPAADKSRALARVEVGQQMQLTQAAEMADMSLAKLKSFNAGYTAGITAPDARGPQYILVPKSKAALLRNSLATNDIAAVQPRALASNRSASGRYSYTVRSGDTLSGIAKRLKVSVNELKRSNNLHSSSVKIGQKLQIKGGSDTTALANNISVTYQVRSGDSFDSIAGRHGVNIKDVMRWNDSVTGKIQPGDRLTLFVNNSTPPES